MLQILIQIYLQFLFSVKSTTCVGLGTCFYHGLDVNWAMVMWPPCWRVTHSLTDHFNEQTRTNMSQPGRRLGTAIGDERHVLQTLWSMKDI